MDDKTAGASLNELKGVYDYFFNQGTTLSKIKDAALGDKLFPGPISSSGSIGIPGRSIAWKVELFLLVHEPLETPPLHAQWLLDALGTNRKAYKELLLEKMRAPDGSYNADLVLPGTASVGVKGWKRKGGSLTRSASNPDLGTVGDGKSPVSALATADTHQKSESSSNLELNNPLSLHNENPWNAWFTSVELRKTILQDVERTFPDIPYFRRQDVQLQLTNILFLFSVQRPSIGYRQGMHELLAPLYHAVAFDAIMEEKEDASTDADTVLTELCSSLWVAADAWALFEAVMQGVSRWYEWQEDPNIQSSGKANTKVAMLKNQQGGRQSPLHAQVRFDVKEGQQDGMKPYIAPIVQTCNTIQGTLLRMVDPQLYRAMKDTGLEPQIYGIRWLRLLFTRELSIPDALKLWDGLFACDPTFDLAQWVCVVMLIRIRNHLIPADYSGQLTLLLRYPSVTLGDASTPHHATLLLRQALALQVAPSPATGASLMLENRTILDIPVEILAPAPVSVGPKKGHLGRHQIASVPRREGSPGQGHGRLSSSPTLGLPEMLARGLMERGESLGINKTLTSALSELKRNIPDLASSLVRPTNQGEMAFPLEDERPPQEQPPWEPKTRLEVERDITHLRARDKQLGESLGWIVDALLQDEEETENRQRLQKEKREAIEALAYIRDVLISDAMVLEGDRLLGEEEALRRRARAQGREATGTTKITKSSPPNLPKMVLPVPLPVVDSRLKGVGSQRQSSGSLSTKAVSQAQALIPSTSAEAVIGGGPALAPWNYTRSSFSGTSALPSTTLPRPPPPTSRNLRRAGGERSSDQTPTPRGETGYGDPLGAIR